MTRQHQTNHMGTRGDDQPADLVAELSAMAEVAGLPYFLLSELPRGDRTTFSETRIADNWPEELRTSYSQSDQFFGSEIIRSLRDTIRPVFHMRSGFESHAAVDVRSPVAVLFKKHGFERSFVFALHDIDLKHHLFAFSGSRSALSHAEEQQIVCEGIALLDKLGRKDRNADSPSERLTGREIECLRWSAAGKSSEEIAIILELSAYTVAGYLKSAMRKLDAVSRVQAIARAYRYRLL